jgi:hypothetical protein
MTTNGNLRDFSLPELLQFLDSGKKTGLLHLQYLYKTQETTQQKYYYIWLNKGRVIAASERSDQQGLMLMITKRAWISKSKITNVTKTSACFIKEPMGLCLKSQGLLQAEQLKLLFNSQVLRPISTLIQVTDVVFKFEQTPFLPLGEMTGLSMSGTEVILTCLRSLKNWNALKDKLPDANSGLSRVANKQLQVLLNHQELQVCKYIDSQLSLTDIASQIQTRVETVQQIAFRLIMIGLVEENFLVATSNLSNSSQFIPIPKFMQSLPKESKKPVISHSFLQNLVSFLKAKAS